MGELPLQTTMERLGNKRMRWHEVSGTERTRPDMILLFEVECRLVSKASLMAPLCTDARSLAIRQLPRWEVAFADAWVPR